MLFLPCLIFLTAAVSPQETVLYSFDADAPPTGMVCNNTAAAMVPHGAGRALQVDFKKVDWPNVTFTPGTGA